MSPCPSLAVDVALPVTLGDCVSHVSGRHLLLAAPITCQLHFPSPVIALRVQGRAHALLSTPGRPCTPRLPIIIVGQNIQGAAADKRAQQTYDDAEAVLHEALQIQQHLKVQDRHLQHQDQRLQEIIEALLHAYPAAASEVSARDAVTAAPRSMASSTHA